MKQHDMHDIADNKKWLGIIGIGEDGLDGLGKAAFNRLQNAEIVFGGERHLAFLNSHFRAKRILWSKPFADSIEKVRKFEGHQVVLLASGDPMFYGAGATLLRYIVSEEVDIYPYVSSFSLAAARLAWPLQETECCSVHGRPLSGILRLVEHGARLLVLSNDGCTPALLAGILKGRGFSASNMTVLEHLGGKKERIISDQASAFEKKIFASLNIVAIDCIGQHASFPRFSSLPDHAFAHDGQLTKQDVRAATLAHLSPGYGELLWDVGAGCGSVSIEWMRKGRNVRVIAVEQNNNRCAYIRQNADKFGFPELQIAKGRAPVILNNLEAPDAVFIGGGISTPGLLETCWQLLKPGGRLVANAVTMEGETSMIHWSKGKKTRMLKISVSESEALGRFHIWRQALPVVMLIARKSV